MSTLIASSKPVHKVPAGTTQALLGCADDAPAYTAEVLDDLIKRVGVSRFVSRINSGFIQPDAGFEAVERAIRSEKERPLLGLLSNFFLGRPDSYRR